MNYAEVVHGIFLPAQPPTHSIHTPANHDRFFLRPMQTLSEARQTHPKLIQTAP